jgi:hypothetical protein
MQTEFGTAGFIIMKLLLLYYSSMAEYELSMSHFQNNWELACTGFCFTGSKSFFFSVSSKRMNSSYTHFIPKSSVRVTCKQLLPPQPFYE